MSNTDTKKGFFLVIAGNIGVGKTTFTELLSERLGWKPYYEVVKENPYLAEFYENMEQWGFHSQIYFLNQRFKSHRQIDEIEQPIIQDRSIFEDAEVFAENLFRQGVLSQREHDTYRQLYSVMIEILRPPDLTVYLRASTWTLLSRIRKRWRDVERDIDKEYLFQLNLAYEKWIDAWGKKHTVQIVETDGKDFLEEGEWTEELILEIENSYRSHLGRS